jgi:hypothetical protein
MPRVSDRPDALKLRHQLNGPTLVSSPTLGCFCSLEGFQHSDASFRSTVTALLRATSTFSTTSECPLAGISAAPERGRPPSSISIAPPTRRGRLPSSISAAPFVRHGLLQRVADLLHRSSDSSCQIRRDLLHPSGELCATGELYTGELHTLTSLPFTRSKEMLR